MGELFLNILVFYSPNYKTYTNGTKLRGSVVKKISLREQFISFYESIQTNLKCVKYRISIVHSTEFSEEDKEVLGKLDIDFLKAEVKVPTDEWNCAIERYNVEPKTKGSHRLIAETDMLLLKDPEFEWERDFQMCYDGKKVDKWIMEYICNKYNLKPLSNKIDWKITDYHKAYHINKVSYEKICPHINNGLVLIKEEKSKYFYDTYLLPVFRTLWLDKTIMNYDAHFAGQMTMGLLLLTLSDSWAPFKRGINIGKHIKEFGKENITLLHYCGINGSEMVMKEFPSYVKK
jgi:hypothetical protein